MNFKTIYPYERQIVGEIRQGFQRQKQLLHIMTGPRQVGKTTAALQIAAKWPGLVIKASADQPLPPGPEWIHAHWERAVRAAQNNADKKTAVLLILDEIQKVQGWSEVIKALWDEQCANPCELMVLLLGSSSLLIRKGLSESLAGRFFLYRCTHWCFDEMDDSFGWELDKWIFFGGYPGTAELINEEAVWASYIRDALIETVLARDILQLQTVAKPALLRHVFLLACTYPARILSYNKMLGQLQDAGNTTTLAHYLKLLESAFLVSGLELFKRGRPQKRGSSPKLVLWNNALINAVTGDSFQKSHDDYGWWGRLVENAVGAHLLNHLAGLPHTIYYWRHRNLEVDYVVESPRKLWALEVKSGKPEKSRGLSKFCDLYPETRPMIIGSGGIELETFFKTHPRELF